MKTSISKSILLLFSIFLFSNLLAQESYVLQYKYLKGSTYRYKSVANFSSTQEMAGQEMKVTGSTESVSRIDIDKVAANGDFTIIYSYDDMKVTTKAAGYDTTMVQKELIGKRTKYIFSNLGKELSSFAIDSIKIGGEAMGMDLGSGTNQKFNELPGNKLSVGGKWSVNKQDTVAIGGGSMLTKASVEYVLVGKEMKNGHNCLRIDYTSKLEMGGKMNQMGMDMFIEGTGNTKGSVWFDQAKGIWISDESEVDTDMTIAMTGQMAMTIPMTQKVKTVQNIIE